MDAELRRTICRLVAGIIVSDDDVDPREDHFITRMLAGFGIPDSERSVIFPILDLGEAVATMQSLPEIVKDEAMTLLLNAACADGKVVESEREYLHAVARTAGISAEETDRMINVRLSIG